MNTLFPAVNFLKCVVTEVGLFSMLLLRHLTFHVRGSLCVNVQNFVVIFYFLKMAAVRHLGFVVCVFEQPTKSIWRCL